MRFVLPSTGLLVTNHWNILITSYITLITENFICGLARNSIKGVEKLSSKIARDFPTNVMDAPYIPRQAYVDSSRSLH